jgi:hypothetical protein
MENSFGVYLPEIGWEGVDLKHLAQDWDQWRAFVNTVNELSAYIKGGNFLTE